MQRASRALAFVTLVLGAATGWPQQIVNEPNQPIELVESMSDTEGEVPRLTVKVMNVSQQPIAAYGILIKFKDETGKTVTKSTHFAAKVIEPSDKGFAPRETSNDRIQLPRDGKTGKPFTNYEVTVDYVAFQNGSAWGRDEMKMSQKYADWKAGAAMVRARARAQSRKK